MQQSAANARSLAGTDRIGAEVSPDHKSEIDKHLQAEGFNIAMAGDGINNAPARCSGIGIRQR